MEQYTLIGNCLTAFSQLSFFPSFILIGYAAACIVWWGTEVC